MLIGVKGFYQRSVNSMNKHQINKTIRELKDTIAILEKEKNRGDSNAIRTFKRK